MEGQPTYKQDIRSLSLEELKQAMASLGEKPYRAGQIYERSRVSCRTESRTGFEKLYGA